MLGFGPGDAKTIFRDLGELLVFASPALVAPALVGLVYSEPLENLAVFAGTAVIGVLLGALFKFAGKDSMQTQPKHALAVTALIWLLYTMLGSVPFIYILNLPLQHAYFESMSMLTTTGITILGDLDGVPKSLVFWRSFMSWVGGIGVVVLALSGVLQSQVKSVMLSVAEGREERLRPHIANTLREVWGIYLVATIACTALLAVLGMDAFNAVNYAMSAISTNGAAPNTAGINAYPSIPIYAVLLAFMFFGAIGFYSHYVALVKRDPWEYARNPEVLIFVAIMVFGSFLAVGEMGLARGIFHGASGASNAGMNIVPPQEIKEHWSEFNKLLVALLMIIGTGVGSTGGGIKLARFGVIVQSLYWRIKSTVLPENTYFKKEFGGAVITDEALDGVYQMVAVYVLLMLFTALVLTLNGAPAIDALFEASSAQANLGLSAGVSSQEMPLASEISLIIAMWVGRLEVIPVLALIGFFIVQRKYYWS